MPDRFAERPSLRLIAGDLISSIAEDVDSMAAAALHVGGRRVPIQSSAPPREEMAREKPKTRVAIIGGGIAGLSAAWSLVRDRGYDAELTVYEADGAVGGKLRLNEIEGMSLDSGAESMLAVRPEALALARSVGLGSSIVNPATTQASIVCRTKLKPIPSGLVTGIPTDLRALAVSEILSVSGLLRVPLDHVLPKTAIDGDVSVGEYVGTRLGSEVVERLVEPLLGGVYAGRADQLSLEMAVPALFRLAKRERSLLAAAKEAKATGAAPSGARRGPIFAGISGGVGRLPIALADRLERRGVKIARGTTVTGLRQNSTGWRLIVSEGGDTRKVDVDAVVLAVPAPAAAKLLRRVNPQASTVLDTVNYASVALVTMLYEQHHVPATLQGSGFLVPPIEGFSVKAATYSSRKWAWVARSGVASRKSDRPSFTVVRASLGRFGEPQVLQRSDEEVAALAGLELHALAGLPLRPAVSVVNRWGGALPQYTVGHRGRVAQIRQSLIDTPGISVCGAAYDGVGIAACIGSAQLAAGQVVTYLSERGQWAYG